MRSIDCSSWLRGTYVETDSGLLGALYALDEKLRRMHVGIWMFFIETFPDFWRRLWKWLLGKIEFLVRVSVWLCRISVLLVALLVVVVGPLWVIPGWISSGWMVLTIIGSIYGLNRSQKWRRVASAAAVTLMPRKA